MIGCVLLDHMSATLKRYVAEHGRKPEILAIGRWDAREIARYAAALSGGVTSAPSARGLFRGLCSGDAVLFGVPIQVDARIGRMPGELWWQP